MVHKPSPVASRTSSGGVWRVQAAPITSSYKWLVRHQSRLINPPSHLLHTNRVTSIVRRSDIFDPFQGFPFDAFHSLVQTRPAGFVDETSAFANTRIDWKETPEAHVFKADLAGLKKEEVKVEIEEGRVLQISGERTKEQEEKNDKWHRVERSSGEFLRRFRLPENAKVDQVKASMENGVLTVTIPKEAAKKPEVKSIEISS